MNHNLQLPVTKVACVVHHAPSLRGGLLDPILPFELNQLQHLIRSKRIEIEQIHNVPTKVGEGRPENRVARRVGSTGKCRAQIFHSELAAPSVQ